MFWEKKKSEDQLPDLPRSPASGRAGFSAYEKPELEDDIHELPSFPDSPSQRGFSQSAIREAVTQESSDEDNIQGIVREPPRDEGYKLSGSMEMPNWSPRLPPQTARGHDKPVFVRLDRFQLAVNSLETVKVKLSEIEELLKKIRDVKNREDQELSAWEAEMENIKNRIQSVMSDIFDKAEF